MEAARISLGRGGMRSIVHSFIPLRLQLFTKGIVELGFLNTLFPAEFYNQVTLRLVSMQLASSKGQCHTTADHSAASGGSLGGHPKRGVVCAYPLHCRVISVQHASVPRR